MLLPASRPTPCGGLEAAALPMAVETAARSLDLLGLSSGQTLLINDGGTMTGFAAVQMARMRGARVIATAGETFDAANSCSCPTVPTRRAEAGLFRRRNARCSCEGETGSPAHGRPERARAPAARGG